MQARLAANLERSFEITLQPEDVQHLTTVRAVLQCVRLRRWERDTAIHAVEELDTAMTAEAVNATPGMRQRFVRYTAPTPPVHLPTAAAFAVRKS